jgi:hypothetical protein
MKCGLSSKKTIKLPTIRADGGRLLDWTRFGPGQWTDSSRSCGETNRCFPGGVDSYNRGKDRHEELERTNGILRQQTGRWHRQQNKFAKVWEQTKVTARLVVSYFNWIWKNIRLGTTAAQRSGLTDQRWSWNDLISYPTVV